MHGHANFDIESAGRYLSILAPAEDHFTFQTFDDCKSGAIVPRRFDGTLEAYSQALAEENYNGAGVFVTVNETNLAGRKIGDVVAPRALWLELDEGLPDLPLTPSVTSETSAGRYHAIFAIPSLTWELFDRAMPILARRFRGDANAIDRARVLRLPGFFHRKAGSNMVRIVDELTSARSYSVEEITKAFEISHASPKTSRAGRPRGRIGWDGSQRDFEKVVSALRTIEAACDANGGAIIIQTEGHQEELIDWSNRGWWLKVGFCLHHFFGGSAKGYDLWVSASGGDESLGLHGCPDKFDPHDQRRSWEGFSSLPGALCVPGRWRTIATIFWAASECGWRQVGRPFSAPMLGTIHPSNEAVMDAGRTAVALGLEQLLQAHDEQAQLRYSGIMLKLLKGMLQHVDVSSGVGQLPPLQALARKLGTSEETIRSYLKRLKAKGVIIKSDGTGRAHKAKGIAYAFTSAIIATTGALCSGNVSTTTGGVTGELMSYSPEVKTLLHAEGGNGIALWLTHVALPPVIIDRVKEAQAAGRAERTLVRIAQELWYWHNTGMEHRELVQAVHATYSDFVGIAAGRAHRRGRITGAERLDENALTASKYLDTFLKAMGRYSLARCFQSPEAQRNLQGRRKKEQGRRAQIERDAFEFYWTREDPDYAKAHGFIVDLGGTTRDGCVSRTDSSSPAA